MRRAFLYILILVPLLACERVTNWDFDEPAELKLVVEGVITNNPSLNYVKLSIPVTEPGEKPLPLSTPSVSIIDSEGVHPLGVILSEPGTFIPSPPITGVVGGVYRLYVAAAGFEFISDPVAMVPVAPMEELRYYESGWQPGYFVINPIEEPDASFTQYICRYENPEMPGDTLVNRFYTYRLISIDVNQFFKPAAERLLFPAGTEVTRIKYSLAPAHQAYIRALLSETEWNGGWFDVVPGNIPTNMSEGSVGWFGACSVVTDTGIIR